MKYYVDSGNLRYICNAESPIEAIQKALGSSRILALGKILRVSQQGFDFFHPGDLIFDTMELVNNTPPS